MSLADQYKRQRAWRSWQTIYRALPPLGGATVLDLGCAIGDQAADLAARGARVVGFDGNEELLAEARSRGVPNAEFRAADLRSLPPLGFEADGAWCSFAAAYFVDLREVLAHWSSRLRPGGWIALTEIDDLFAHEPLRPRTRELLEAYVADGLAARRYDFRMGRRLEDCLERAGFMVERSFVAPDLELSFSGPAPPDVLDAWRARLDRMKLLHHMCAGEWPDVRDDFLACLARPDHRSLATVRCCVARRADDGARGASGA